MFAVFEKELGISARPRNAVKEVGDGRGQRARPGDAYGYERVRKHTPPPKRRLIPGKLDNQFQDGFLPAGG